VDAKRVMQEVGAAAREDRRARLLRGGAPASYNDPALYADVEDTLRRGIDRGGRGLVLPELLNDDDVWTLRAGLQVRSHRPLVGGGLVLLKQRVLFPLLRWLFEYSRENFRRQQRINQLLAASVEELAIENARLRRAIDQLRRDGGRAETLK
jgi:hypothetical protein